VTWTHPETLTYSLLGLTTINQFKIAVDNPVLTGFAEPTSTYVSSADVNGVALSQATYTSLNGASRQETVANNASGSGGTNGGGYQLIDASPWNASLGIRQIGTPAQPIQIDGGGGTDTVYVLGTPTDYAISGLGTSTVTLFENVGLGQNAVLKNVAQIAFQDGTIVSNVAGVLNAASPAINSVSPTSINAGANAFTLTVNGTNFTSGNVVQWNGMSLVTTFVSSTQLTAPVSSSLIASAGLASVAVSSPGQTSSPASFTVNGSSAGGGSVPDGSTILPQFVFGDGWYTALYFTNTSGASVSFPVNFIGDDGRPLDVPTQGGSSCQVNLAANGTAIIEAPNVGSLAEGYARFTLPSGVVGYGVFRQSIVGVPDQEAVVPLSSALTSSNTLTWDETNVSTGVAIVNPTSNSIVVTITVRDTNGNMIGSSTVPLPPNGKTEAYLRALPGLGAMVGTRGSAEFVAQTGNVAVLGLRFDGVAFTSIPTTPVTTTSNSIPVVLPQFAFGGGWYSALYFTNVTGTPISFPVNFVSDLGIPLIIQALGESTAQVALKAYGTTIIEAPNVGSLLQGYANFTLPGGVFGYGVFRQSIGGLPDQEAVVPLSVMNSSSSVLTWDETNFMTGVAVVNPSSASATIAVTVWDTTGKTIGTSSISLPSNGKTAMFLQTLPGLGGMVGKRGLAQFASSTGSVAILGLRFDGSAFTSIPATNLTIGVTGKFGLPAATMYPESLKRPR